MEEDKRTSPRFSFSEPVAYGHSDISVSGSVAGNISLSGISLKVQGFVPIGTILELQVHLDQSPKILWLKGQVVRVREVLSEGCFEIGIKFIQDEECIKAIGQYLQATAGLNQQNKSVKE